MTANVPFCIEKNSANQAPKTSSCCPHGCCASQQQPYCAQGKEVRGGEPGGSRGSVQTSVATVEAVFPGQVKAGQKSALKTDPEIKKLRFT